MSVPAAPRASVTPSSRKSSMAAATARQGAMALARSAVRSVTGEFMLAQGLETAMGPETFSRMESIEAVQMNGLGSPVLASRSW